MISQKNIKSVTELEFEQEVIDYLTNIGGVKQWEYKKEINNIDQLWDNFKNILEKNNQARLNKPLSKQEFNQVKKVINNIKTPYEAGQFLYGVNGVSEIEVSLDDDRHVFLTVFDQSQVGGGSTVYQIVNQIVSKPVISGRQERRFDVTLLINGLPIIQIELKKVLHNSNDSLSQMEQYISERQYEGIYSTLQVLIAMTPYDIKYMANTTINQFNKEFAFNWQNENDSNPIRSWKEFSDKVLSIPMAHELATRYMILDGTKNKECIKVMRPYQVYATKKVLDLVKKHDFSFSDGKLGYIWHTTGSGKTITSFKTAWLTSKLPNVDKVIFLVDRIALTNQTVNAYKAYDPISGLTDKSGVISDTANVSDLHNKLNRKTDKNIIVTSIQKMSRYALRKDMKKGKQNILFIVDEAHRSTGDGSDNKGMLEAIRREYPTAAWIGYTGTPKFPETSDVFGSLLHAYTIKDAIADKNVLGFNVEFKETIKAPENPSDEDIDDNIKESIYDRKDEHVELVVEDIFNNWRKRSNDRKYNALLTVHVGGNKPSIPRAMQYFREFEKRNKEKPGADKIKVAISFSQDTSNGNNQLTNNNDLFYAIRAYNEIFGTVFDMSTVKAYVDDVISRLNKTIDDRNYLDLVIVVDQLLTGFDAPELNTLYVDRTLKGSSLIQAYSRTNRIHSAVNKPWGNVINYRWPNQNELEMNKAFAIYSNKDSANKQLTLDEYRNSNQNDNIISKSFSDAKEELKEVVEELKNLTNDFKRVPASEREQNELFSKIREYNILLSKLKQYSEDDNKNPISAYDNPEEFYNLIGMTEEKELILATVLAPELRSSRAKKENVDISEIDLEMIHIREIRIDYDYLIDLIAQLANEVYKTEWDKAEITKEKIDSEVAKSNNESEKRKVRKFVSKIFSQEFEFDNYPVEANVEAISEAMNKMQKDENISIITQFIRDWGLDYSIGPKDLSLLMEKHKIGQEDLDKQGEFTAIMNGAKDTYSSIASKDIAKLTWVKYRIELRKEFYKIADEIKNNE
ncbi:Type I site-specific restriction-modification system, R (restriction) subunit [Alteracholeplasma palmae J233]|uniref:Type I restriction enzyme endonuclease subunit n=1 Tax=Alteracholeplasma palmae (strain ATCC 49389 / J233) TaxID=1318466 RepID=U4KK49_ALTPJ|nr:HsdR family type I site-specific deoxyribonuclease [Alteracholeplasma palmae]CCV63888.1 Type I site-specific restriction-modification system, R (restriction) subunit [Alteracholeplasma palmae J233]